MQLGAPLSFVSSVVALAHTLQLPIWPSHHRQDAPKPIISDDKPIQWHLDEPPNPNATDHLVFETVYSLLQHWPSVYMVNGHNIVPGIIPEGTLLYHDTDRERLPDSAEWVAFDPEHAYYYCRKQADPSSPQPSCWQLTLTTTRPLKVIYFDGESAAKNPRGSLDTQDFLAWGEWRPDHQWDEAERAESLCSWGVKFGIDGFVRTEMDFELILCDFTAGVSVTSFSNIVRVPGRPGDASRIFVNTEMVRAASWHNHFPGETRIQLDLAGLVSFYDTELVPSLVAVRAGQDRLFHRARDASKEDLLAVVSRLEAALTRPSGSSSGVDWKTLIQIIYDRYAGRLELTQRLIDSPATSPDEILDLAIKTQTHLRIMLIPYLRVSDVPTDSDKNAMDWAIPVYKDCATTHIRFAASKLGFMTDSEKLLLRAVRETNREICRVVTRMWAAGVYAGIDLSLNTMDPVDIAELTRVWRVWREDLNRLMWWLDWNVWVKCKPGCGPEEICTLHKWPWYFPSSFFTLEDEGRIVSSMPEHDGPRGVATENEFRPQPKCISLVDPHM